MALVLTDVRDGVATLTLNNPDERNTLTAAMVTEITAAMDVIEADESIGALVVTGAPPAFCAGANLGNLATADGSSLGNVYEGFLRIARSPLPTIAAVNGAAVGAGMNLALGCDVRLAARRARFDTRFLQLGLHPGGGHTWMFRRIAGPQARWRRSCSATCSTAPRPSASASCTAASTTTPWPTPPTSWRRRAASAPRELAIPHEGDDHATWPTSPTTPRRWPASSSRSSGAPANRGSPSVWRRSRPASPNRR